MLPASFQLHMTVFDLHGGGASPSKPILLVLTGGGMVFVMVPGGPPGAGGAVGTVGAGGAAGPPGACWTTPA